MWRRYNLTRLIDRWTASCEPCWEVTSPGHRPLSPNLGFPLGPQGNHGMNQQTLKVSYTTWKASMAIATPISLGLSCSLTNSPPFGGCAIYFHYGVTWLVVCLPPPLLFLQNLAKKIENLGVFISQLQNNNPSANLRRSSSRVNRFSWTWWRNAWLVRPGRPALGYLGRFFSGCLIFWVEKNPKDHLDAPNHLDAPFFKCTSQDLPRA